MINAHKLPGSNATYYIGADQSPAGKAALADIVALRNLAVELAQALDNLESHVDVSTIRPGIKHEREWGALVDQANAALATLRGSAEVAR
jgi:hypothetical protein